MLSICLVCLPCVLGMGVVGTRSLYRLLLLPWLSVVAPSQPAPGQSAEAIHPPLGCCCVLVLVAGVDGVCGVAAWQWQWPWLRARISLGVVRRLHDFREQRRRTGDRKQQPRQATEVTAYYFFLTDSPRKA